MFRIMIVDDENVICDLLRSLLESEGFVAEVANRVDAAKVRLLEQKFDLVLTDINMPDQSGLDLIQFIREQQLDTGAVVVSVIDKPEEARKCLDLGVYGYIIKPFTRNLVLITVENALKLLELERRERRLKHSSEEKNRLIMDHIGIGIALISTDGRVLEMNKRMKAWFPQAQAGSDRPCYQIFGDEERTRPCFGCPTMRALQSGLVDEAIVGDYRQTGKKSFRITASPVKDKEGRIFAAIEMVEDVTEKLVLERDLRQAQKLEAIGQLAAGIAHEINTPIQYVTDNVNFMNEAFGEMIAGLRIYEEFLTGAQTAGELETIRRQTADCKENLRGLDLEYFLEEVPRSVVQSLDGLDKVGKIVRAMKLVAHPGSDSRHLCDLNRLLENIIVISRNEWKYVADIETDFAEDLPGLSCYPDKLNQVFLNLIVNAAHTIGDAVAAKKYDKGRILLSTSASSAMIRVQLTDNGCGIPEAIRDKVYDLFFTTKEAGKGTGQGLAIARRIIVEDHCGQLAFTSKEGEGTMFTVDLPLAVSEESGKQ